MKKRLDQLLVELGRFPTRTQAQAAIMAGLVLVGGRKIDKPGTSVDPAAAIEVKGAPHPYVGRGGLKLAKALTEFGIDVAGRTALDIGASTGGFTDCLLQGGAALVYAVDVGYGQLDWKLRNDPRVIVFEKTNVRYLTPERLYAEKRSGAADLAVIDVSFISLSKVLPVVYNLLAVRAEAVALIKPQFEARREQVGRGGIVREEAVRQEVVEKVRRSAAEAGFAVEGLSESPITGADGNVEFLIYLQKGKAA